MSETKKEVAERAAENVKVNPVSVYVPELVTVEQHQAAVERLHDEILRLKKALPEKSSIAFDENKFDDEYETDNRLMR